MEKSASKLQRKNFSEVSALSVYKSPQKGTDALLIGTTTGSARRRTRPGSNSACGTTPAAPTAASPSPPSAVASGPAISSGDSRRRFCRRGATRVGRRLCGSQSPRATGRVSGAVQPLVWTLPVSRHGVMVYRLKHLPVSGNSQHLITFANI